MALTPGTRIGPYEVVAQIGAGGMGEVYRATDTTLGRQVAIKILPEAFASDPERLARFEREAKTLASLNHPHIAAIYGFERAGITYALVMELVEGEDLSQRIARGAMPVDEALPIATQIAQALEAAHEQGVIHRDLKPANIKVRPDGTVKVLDFGLAKLAGPAEAGHYVRGGLANDADDRSARLQPGLSQAPTIATPAMMTGVGMVLGTAAYMSPEQARGRAVDRRTDIWAFGCMLYEMLTGRRAFTGDDVTETLAAVVKSEPDWEALPGGLPPTARLFLRRCLHKDPRQRVGDTRDVRLALEGAFETKEGTNAERRQRNRHALSAPLVLAGVAASAILGAIGTVLFRAPAPEAPEVRLQVETPPGASEASWSISFAISPDGRAIVFEGAAEGERPRLWLRSLDSDEIRPLPGTEGGSFPFWSPDSRSIGFRVTDEGLKRLDLESQVTRTVSSGPAVTGTWGPDGSIVFNPSVTTPLFRVPATGGQPVEVTRVEAPQTGHRFPQFLPDGRHFVFFVTGTPEVRGVYVGALGSTESRRLFDADSRPEFLPPDYLVFSRQDALLAQRLDLGTVTTIGEPFVVGPMTASQPGFIASMAMSASRTGTFVYRPAVVESRQLTWFDRSGKPVNSIGEPDTQAQETGSLVTLSPDGSTVAKARLVNGNRDIWLIETARGVMRRLTSDPGIDREPVWSPDGTRIAFSSVRKGLGDLYQTSATGTTRDEELFESPINKNVLDWSPDGQFILYAVQDPVTRRDLWALPLTGDRTPMVLVQSAAEETGARFSPDGRWIVYESDETGEPEIFMTSFPRPTGATQISSAGGTGPQWRQDGREIFFSAPDGRLTSVAVTLRPEGRVELGTPVPLFAMQPGATVVAAPDGQRFLIDTPTGDARSTRLNVVLNWKPRVQ